MRLHVGDHLGSVFLELVSRCVECGLAEPESLASLGGSAPGVVDGILSVPAGYKHITCHMLFDIKTDLTCKAQLIGGGHLTDPPKELTFSSVVTQYIVRITFTIYALNELDVLAVDVQNAYLNTPMKEHCYTTAGLEWGMSNLEQPILIIHAINVLKSSAARWRGHTSLT